MMRLGISGTGRMATRMISTATGLPGVRVTAIASGQADRAHSLAGPLGAAVSTPDGLASRPDVDAVYVASRNADHAAAVRAALAAGKPVLVEKPLGVDLAETDSLLAAAESSGTLLVENLWTLALPATLAFLDKAAGVGQPGIFGFDFGYPVTREAWPSLFAPDAGVLRDRAVYGLALALRLAGPVVDLSSILRKDGDTDTAALIELRHEDGGLSRIAVAFDARLPNGISFAGPKGCLVLEPSIGAEWLVQREAQPDTGAAHSRLGAALRRQPALRRLARLRQPRPSHIGFGADPYLPMLTHFRDLVASGARESPLVPLSLSRDVQELLARIRAAAGGGTP